MFSSLFGAKRLALGLLGLDGDAPRPGRLMLGQRHQQDALLEPRLNLVGVHDARQGDGPAKLAEAPLLPVPDALGRLKRYALARNGQLVALVDVEFEFVQ